MTDGPVRLLPPTADRALIEAAGDLLRHAERGEVSEFAITFRTRDGARQIASTHDAGANLLTLLGMIEVLRAHVLEGVGK